MTTRRRPRQAVQSPLEGLEETGLSRRVEVHDRNQLELKLGYTLDPHQKSEIYTVQALLFLPRTLGIGSHNYTAATFYSDTAAFLRFQTPRVALQELGDPKKATEWFEPIATWSDTLKSHHDRWPALERDLADNLKVLGCVYRAAIRNAASTLRASARELRYVRGEPRNSDVDWLSDAVVRFVQRLEAATARWRGLSDHCCGDGAPDSVASAYAIVDEYISLVAKDMAISVVASLDKTLRQLDEMEDSEQHAQALDGPREVVARACVRLANYNERAGYVQAESDSHEDEDEDDLDGAKTNEAFPYRRRLLKRAVFSPLYLEVRDANVVRVANNIAGMVAAAAAMTFAVGMAVWSQLVWGIMTWPFVVIAVLSYMVKDRIKEWGRGYFRRRFKRFFPDHALTIRAHGDDRNLGTCREEFTVKDPADLAPDVLAVRYPERSDSLGRQARPEVVLAYTKQVTLQRWGHSERGNGQAAADFSAKFIGVHDIIRFNLGRLRSRMDAPDESYRRVDPDTLEIVKVATSRVYHINIVLKLTLGDGSDVTTSLERLRLVMDQRGIKRVEEVTWSEDS